MPDIHPPDLEAEDEDDPGSSADAITPRASQVAGRVTHRTKSLLKIGLEVLLISTGVFLGLMGEQWRESAQHRELADAALRRFRVEIQANRKAVDDVKDYHVTAAKSVDTYFAADAKERAAIGVHLKGVQPAFLERSAWDLALATQSLAYLDPELALALSRIYTSQEQYVELTRGLTQAMYLRPPVDELAPFLAALKIYYGDILLLEPALLTQYDGILPKIDRALGESASEKAAAR